MRENESDEAHCELRFSPNVKLIATVRRFVGEFYERVLEDPAITSRLVVATHELLENAVRYSIDGQSGIRVGVKRRQGAVDVVIDTNNRTGPENRAALLALLEEMRGSSDPDAFYQTLIRRTAKRPVGSGLGLGRIYAESQMSLSCRLENDDVVSLRAEATFPWKGVKA